MIRILAGKQAATHADLELVLTAEQPESGFSPAREAAMLKNIRACANAGYESVMVPRADIVAVQRDVAMGERPCSKAPRVSRLVVYNDTLDDPVGMVHIQWRRLHGPPARGTSIRRPSRNCRRPISISRSTFQMPLAAAKIYVREMLYAPPSMPALDLLARCRRRAFTWRWLSTNMAVATVSSRSRIWSS